MSCDCEVRKQGRGIALGMAWSDSGTCRSGDTVSLTPCALSIPYLTLTSLDKVISPLVRGPRLLVARYPVRYADRKIDMRDRPSSRCGRCTCDCSLSYLCTALYNQPVSLALPHAIICVQALALDSPGPGPSGYIFTCTRRRGAFTSSVPGYVRVCE